MSLNFPVGEAEIIISNVKVRSLRLKIRDLPKVTDMENHRATTQLQVFRLVGCFSYVTWYQLLSELGWPRARVHTRYICSCIFTHTHYQVGIFKNHQTELKTLLRSASSEKEKRGRKIHSHHFFPARCLYSVTRIWCSSEWLGENHQPPHTLWPPKISSGTRGKLVRISQAVNSNRGSYINIPKLKLNRVYLNKKSEQCCRWQNPGGGLGERKAKPVRGNNCGKAGSHWAFRIQLRFFQAFAFFRFSSVSSESPALEIVEYNPTHPLNWWKGEGPSMLAY